MSKNFCTHCGAPLIPMTSFCTNCGAPIYASEDSSQASAQQSSPYPPNHSQVPPYPPMPETQHYVPVYVSKPKVPGRGFGISSMVLGIIAIVYSVIVLVMTIAYTSIAWEVMMESQVPVDPNKTMMGSMIFTSVMYAAMSILAICFAFAARSRKYRCAKTTAGLTTGGISLVLYIAAIVVAVIHL